MQGRLLNWYSFIFRKQQSLTALVIFPRIPRNHGQTGGHRKGYSNQKRWRWFAGSTGVPLLGFSLMTTFKDLIGLPPYKLDKDPLKHEIKKVRTQGLSNISLHFQVAVGISVESYHYFHNKDIVL